MTPSATAGLTFPAGFLWGVASSSHQFEGDNTNNQWYAWEEQGRVRDQDRSGLACGWWNQAERDFDLAQELGLNALRLSIEWSRIEPQPGQWNDAALARYRVMLTELRARGITPMVTLHHFSNPLWFEARGAFLARDAVARFTKYVAYVAAGLGDLCDLWCTINEPNVYSAFGYYFGIFPPGKIGGLVDVIRVRGMLARAHAAAYHAIHEHAPHAQVGWAHHFNLFDPARPKNPLDRRIARLQDTAFNDFFVPSIQHGTVAWPYRIITGDLRDVRGTADFVGINVYYRDMVEFDLAHAGELFGRRFVAPGVQRGDHADELMVGETYPAGIKRVAERLAVLGIPLYVTENGVADAHDRVRPWLVAQAAAAVHDALGAGLDMRGYFHWSLVDNFEWGFGWRSRFGLYALDRVTQARTPRKSAGLYSAIARHNALTPAMVATYAPEALPEIFRDS